MIQFKILNKDNQIQNVDETYQEIQFAIDALYSKFQFDKNVLHLFYAGTHDIDSIDSKYDLTEYDKVFLDFSGADYVFRYYDINKIIDRLKVNELYTITKNPIELENSLYIDPLMFRIADLEFEYSFDNKENDYFYFGGHPRYHRLKFLSELKELGLLNKLSWSQRAISDEMHLRDVIPYEYKDSYESLSIISDLPKALDIPLMDNREYHGTKDDKNWVTNNAGVVANLQFQTNHFVEIIAETIYYYSINPTKKDDLFMNFSEKTYKPLSLGYPFIGLLLPYSFKQLMDFGFKLFDEIFDYSFDSIIDDDARMEAVIKQIETNNIADKILNNKESVLEKHLFNRNRFIEFKKEMLGKYEKSLLH